MGAARGKSITEPEVVLRAHRVRDVAEGCCSLVGGNHQIRIIVVIDHQPFRVNGLSVADVVGQIEKAADERLVLLFDENLLFGPVSRDSLQNESTLGPLRYD